MIDENPDIRDKYMLCYTYGMEAHMTKVSYDDIICNYSKPNLKIYSNLSFVIHLIFLLLIWIFPFKS